MWLEDLGVNVRVGLVGDYRMMGEVKSNCCCSKVGFVDWLGRCKVYGFDRGFFVSDEFLVGGMCDGKREVLFNGGVVWFLVVLVFGSWFV